jgi:hypothetical protein
MHPTEIDLHIEKDLCQARNETTSEGIDVNGGLPTIVLDSLLSFQNLSLKVLPVILA